MKLSSTIILRAAIIFISSVVVLLCIFALPAAITSEIKGDFDYGFLFLGMYITVLPFFIALYETLKLLGYIDSGVAFSQKSVISLKRIKYCAYTVSAIYAFALPYIFYIGDNDDAPGVIAVTAIIIGTSFVIGVATAVFQKLTQNVVDIKSENDLTV